ncbi:MAG: hypothetical protein C4567_00155 [Deltaproteobacteria bacterium]|nr:MAG: hypothetical protein C4567_00155 [Deltaproteobacteria bacterium]
MRTASSEYLQEEARSRESRPRVKAVLYPFDLDYGLAPGSGEFLHTAYGGEPGKLVLSEGYFTTASWTSPVMHSYSPYLNLVAAFWDDQAGRMEARVYLRTAITPGDVGAAAYISLNRSQEYPLLPYFQVQAEFRETLRHWAVDAAEDADAVTAYAVNQSPEAGYESYSAEGGFPGYLANLRLEGRLSLPEGEILDPGAVRVELGRDFSELKPGDHALLLDNREGQWLAGGENFYLLGLPWTQKQLALYHGWELPRGRVEWQLVYQGELDRLAGMAHAWRGEHRVCLESRDWVAARLQTRIGAPSPQGERRPFMRGPYRAGAELTETIPAQITEPVKTGSGTAALQVMGDYRGEFDQDYLLHIENSGDVGSASFRWSNNNGQSWRETGLDTTGAEDPVELENGLAVYWESGSGTDLMAGDRWTFSAQAQVYRYQIYGGPFTDISQVYLNGEESRDRVAADPETGVIEVTGRSAAVEARVVKDAATHPVDIITDILTAVGLSPAIEQDSFEMAKSLTPEYAIGVCFENLPAAQALREILKRCLYDFWTDFGEIKIKAYLGED